MAKIENGNRRHMINSVAYYLSSTIYTVKLTLPQLINLLTFALRFAHGWWSLYRLGLLSTNAAAPSRHNICAISAHAGTPMR
jgi:hypothetical protein